MLFRFGLGFGVRFRFGCCVEVGKEGGLVVGFWLGPGFAAEFFEEHAGEAPGALIEEGDLELGGEGA
jgi:hypothetical protein